MGFRELLKGRVSIVCVGNELNGDDALGYRLAARLTGFRGKGLQVIYASTAPENFVDEILSFRPERVVVVDAGDFCGRPGEVRVLGVGDLEGVHISTHRMPMKLFAGRLKQEGVDVVFVGVQAKNAGLGEEMSPEVEEAVSRLYEEVVGARGLR